jgi:hypothetical protein
MKTTFHKGKKQKDWFRLKRYPHVGLQLEPKDRAWIEPYLKDKDAISKHAFYPFIHRQLKVRKFRKEICHDGTRSKLRKPATKKRDIYFSNHLDSNVFSYYSEILSAAYEREISDLGISNCITAYRKIKLNPEKDKSRNKCNIDFAHDIFRFIKANKEKNLVAITFDIKSFFDNLDHRLLKKYWKRIIKSGVDLPEDHYNVFRNITKFAYIEEDDLFDKFKNQIIVERKPKSFKELEIKKKNYLRNKRAVAYCSKDNIEDIRNLSLIKSNKRIKENEDFKLRTKGIPQGSPISATLANVYLLDFDKQTHDILKKIGGVYQRYSDDMVAICPIEFEQEIINHFLSSILTYKLEIQKSKTQVFHFIYSNKTEKHYCFEKNLNTNKLQDNTHFEYLGFQFDGYHTLIKNSSISNYYRKMKRSFARSRFYTFHNRTATKGKVFKTRLYKKFTFVGAERRRIYQRHPSKSDLFILSHKYDWGNFITYAKLAEKTIVDNKIGGQLRRHWRKFHELLKKIEEK